MHIFYMVYSYIYEHMYNFYTLYIVMLKWVELLGVDLLQCMWIIIYDNI